MSTDLAIRRCRGRTQTNGPADYQAVHRVQDGYTITPLSRLGQEPQPVQAQIDPSVDMTTPPLEQVNALSAADDFAYAAELMQLHPPHPTDWSMLARASRIGLQPGQSFDRDAVDPAVQQALEGVPAEALKAMQAKLPTLAPVTNGWLMNTDSVGVSSIPPMGRSTLTSAPGSGRRPAVQLASRSARAVGRHHAPVRAQACRPPRTLGAPADQANLTDTGPPSKTKVEAKPPRGRMGP
jgi:hypothetical protein